MATTTKPKPFKHTPRELVVLNRAHSAMMEHIRAGEYYDVVKRAWVSELPANPRSEGRE